MLKSLTDEELNIHLAKSQYGNFRLTDAIRPAPDATLVQGYRKCGYGGDADRKCISGDVDIPYLVAAVSADTIFECFIALLEQMPEQVAVFLENSHTGVALKRDDIDLTVLISTLWDYEDLLINDGFTSIFVVDYDAPLEIQFEEHKAILAYGYRLSQFESVLHKYGIMHQSDMRLVLEDEHVHSSRSGLTEMFTKLGNHLSMELQNA